MGEFPEKYLYSPPPAQKESPGHSMAGQPLALPLGELSPKVTERAIEVHTLSVLAVLGHLSQRERQGLLARCHLTSGDGCGATQKAPA